MDEIKEGYDRVTKVIGELSGIYKIPRAILDTAAERGTFVHNYIDNFIAGEPMGSPPIPEECQGYVDSFMIWLGDQKDWLDNPDGYLKPERFYCDTLKVTGECDLIIKRQDETVLIDFKTSAKESAGWPIQGSAYVHLAEKYGHIIDKIQFVKLDRKGGWHKTFEYDYNIDLFKNCLAVYRHFNA